MYDGISMALHAYPHRASTALAFFQINCLAFISAMANPRDAPILWRVPLLLQHTSAAGTPGAHWWQWCQHVAQPIQIDLSSLPLPGVTLSCLGATGEVCVPAKCLLLLLRPTLLHGIRLAGECEVTCIILEHNTWVPRDRSSDRPFSLAALEIILQLTFDKIEIHTTGPSGPPILPELPSQVYTRHRVGPATIPQFWLAVDGPAGVFVIRGAGSLLFPHTSEASLIRWSSVRADLFPGPRAGAASVHLFGR